eukprot:m.23220 g.23220  ORF g.23220 m.23220 type:complete len:482 (+) comp7475_c0_seq1:256-1701(+)
MAEEEDLEDNPFFIALSQKFVKFYNQAQDARCLVCVPSTDALQSVSNITQQMVETHVFKPSPYFQGQFVSFAGKERAINVNGNKIECTQGFTHRDEVEILFEELFYNGRYESFRVVCVDRILNTKAQDSKKSTATVNSGQMTQDELKNFLFTHATPEQLQGLDSDITAFNSSYVIVPGYISDVQTKLQTICESMVQRLELSSDTDVPKAAFEIAVETYVLDRTFDKVFPAVLLDYKIESKIWKRIVNDNEKVTGAQLGVQKAFDCSLERAVLCLQGLPTMRAPSQMHICLKATVETITSLVTAHLKRQRKGDIAIATDDLIPLLALVLVQARIENFPAYLSFMEKFGVSAGSVTEEGFNLVSTRAAVTFIKSELGKGIDANHPDISAASPDVVRRKSSPARVYDRNSDLVDKRQGFRRAHSNVSAEGGYTSSAHSSPETSHRLLPPGSSANSNKKEEKVLPGATATVEDMGGFLSKLALGY